MPVILMFKLKLVFSNISFLTNNRHWADAKLYSLMPIHLGKKPSLNIFCRFNS